MKEANKIDEAQSILGAAIFLIAISTLSGIMGFILRHRSDFAIRVLSYSIFGFAAGIWLMVTSIVKFRRLRRRRIENGGIRNQDDR